MRTNIADVSQRSVAGLRPRALERSRRTAFGPERWLYALFATALIAWALFHDRELLLDQVSYESYFLSANIFDEIEAFTRIDNLGKRVAYCFTEEIGWRLYCALLSPFFEPGTNVRITVVVLQILIVLALTGSKHPTTGLLYWIVVPVGLATIGSYQLRQGFAFAIFLVFAMRLKMPLVGGVIASIVHTTLVVPLAMLLAVDVVWRLSLNRKLYVGPIVACALGVTAALLGDILFPVYGGRRVDLAGAEGTGLNLKFVLGNVVILVFAAGMALRAAVKDRVAFLVLCALFGTVSFLVASYFSFHVGTARVSYFPLLLLIMFAHLDFNKNQTVLIAQVALVTIIFYFCYRSAVAGEYNPIIQTIL